MINSGDTIIPDFFYGWLIFRRPLSKHGIDFETAQLLWQDVDLVEIPAKSTDEPRSLMIGLINGKHWSAVITYRNKYIRLIKRSLSKKVTV